MVTEKDVCKCGYNSAMWYAYLLRAWRMAPYETSFDEELQEVGKYMGSIEETCKVSLERAKNELVMLRNKIDTVPPEEKEHSYEKSISDIRDLVLDALSECSPKETYIRKEHLRMTPVRN